MSSSSGSTCGFCGAQRGDLGVAHQLDGLVVGLAVKEALPGEHLVEQDPDREDVGARIDLLAARRLRGEIAHLPFDDPGVGHLDLAGRLGQAEVDDLHLPLLGHQHVGGRDVAVDDPQRRLVLLVGQLVGVGDPFADLHDDVERVRDGDPLADPPAPVEDRLEVDAVDELHDDEVRVLGVPDVEHLHDVRVLERERQPRLVQEHGHELLVLGQRREDALDGDVLLEPAHRLGDATENLRHAAGGHPLGDAISVIRHRRPRSKRAKTARTMTL